MELEIIESDINRITDIIIHTIFYPAINIIAITYVSQT